jgi:hypothetical protein
MPFCFPDALFGGGAAVDVSWPLETGATAFKDAPERAFTVDRFRDWPKDHARESRFAMGLHTGTHIDAPAHFLEGTEPPPLLYQRSCRQRLSAELHALTHLMLRPGVQMGTRSKRRR